MKRSALLGAVAAAALLATLPASGVEAANSHANYRAVCPNPSAGYAHCHELVVTDSHGNPLASSSPTGLDPSTIQSVYGFPTSSTAGAGTTIAIVDAYDDPTAENDLNVFSSQYGLPACTTANGCFTKVNQTGGTNYPRANSGWALEISLDIEWAHAIAPGASILLVEASSNSFANLMAAEDYAGKNAQYVSNSWGGSESSGETSYDSHFIHSGVSFFVSAGDSGLPAEYPSASPNVISVGGTTLTDNGNGTWSETGWSSGGGGCSAYEIATSAQSGFSGYGQAGCNGARATPDVSLDADPNSGVSVYDSTKYYGQTGWWTVGGTSASSPMWAAASADNGATVDSSYVYGNHINFNDVTTGNNGAPCLVGYDLCTGMGSWIYDTSSSLLTGSSGGSTGTLTASFTYSCSDLACNFTDTSTGTDSSATYSWDFGDSSGTSALQNPSHTYPTGGTYTVTLAVTDGTATSSASTSVTVSQPGTQSTMSVTVAAGTVSTKGANYWVPLTVTADGPTTAAPIAGASVQLDVYSGTTCTGSAAASGSATTDSTGSASFNFHTKTSGPWCAEATVTASGYSTGTDQTTFNTP